MAGKKKNTKKGGKKAVYVALLLALIIVPSLATRSDAAEFGLNGEAYSIKYMASINTPADSTDTRGGGLNAVIGPLVTLREGVNTVMSLEFSVGVALMPNGETTNTQAFGGSFGAGPCWMNRIVCTHWGYRIDPQSGERVSQFAGMLDVMPLLNRAASASGL